MLRTFGHGLESLAVSCSRITDGHWLEVLATFPSALPNLETLILQCLARPIEPTSEVMDSRREQKILFHDFSGRFDKAMRGKKDIEIVSLRANIATMKGKQAVKMGLEKIFEYVAAAE